MNIKAKRTIMVILLFAGVVWNCLCLLGIIPLSYFALSALAVGGYSLSIIFLPLLLPALAKADEKSAFYPELTWSEKRLSVVMLALITAWVVTLAACIGCY
ncbi:hypothetical protein OBV_06580 [Oscillibacter valericigenes Sjm18-20]|nr:hypothetical protein OBV_06580 [Oscillibacter valericigenes Sjm18-20]